MSAVLMKKHCRLCECYLNAERPFDDFINLLCSECRDRPEAKQRPTLVRPAPPKLVLSAAEKSLASKVHGFMPAQQLLDLLNERRRVDLGESATLISLGELQEAMRALVAPPGANNWGSLRKLLAQARRDGTLQRIDRQAIDDFAVVWSLQTAQVIRLKDVILGAIAEGGAQ